MFLWSGGSEKKRLFTAGVQNDARSPSRMHAVVFSVDQRLQQLNYNRVQRCEQLGALSC